METDGSVLPGVVVQEDGTTNRTVSDVNGTFHITTLNDTCSLRFLFVGFLPHTIKITENSTVNILLKEDCVGCCDCPGWTSIGVKYDIVNSMFGVIFSNGYDEMPLIHFEEFPDNLTYKMTAQTNFHKDFMFSANLAWNDISWYSSRIERRQGIMPSIGYEHYDYSSKFFFHRDIYASVITHFRLIGAALMLKTGYQTLNDANNWGACLGLQRFIYSRLYSGISVGYYFDYLTYSIYLQGFANRNISYRLSYDRIDNYDFLNIGLNLLFNR